jgi:hypothetical protein
MEIEIQFDQTLLIYRKRESPSGRWFMGGLKTLCLFRQRKSDPAKLLILSLLYNRKDTTQNKVHSLHVLKETVL